MTGILGNFPHDVEIQKRTVTLDAFGGSTETFATTQTVKAWFQPTNSREEEQFNKRGQLITGKFFFDEAITIDEEYRIKYAGDFYDFVAVQDATAGLGRINKVMVKLQTARDQDS